MSQRRIDLMHVNPGVVHAMLGLERQVRQAGLDEKLLDLVRMRASQINRCAYCLDMHSKDARAAGETEQRLYGLEAWRETPYYSARERAALEWTEALTLVSGTGVPDDVYERVRTQFPENELVHLSLAIVAINAPGS
jgi:AhpD family alkylhydroperoxidase